MQENIEWENGNLFGHVAYPNIFYKVMPFAEHRTNTALTQ